jgi:hypothetical protein
MKKLLLTSVILIQLGCAVHTQDSAVTSLSGTCGDNLVAAYQNDVYPFFRDPNHCVHCHVEGGPGLGLFASGDPKVSYAAFTAAGLSTISFMATNPAHQPPYTGPQNQSAVDGFTAKWTQDQSDYNACLAKSQGGQSLSLLTSAQAAPSIYADTTAKQTLRWNLNLASDLDPSTNRAVPAIITIDVQVLMKNNLAAGYIFSNPTLQVTDPTQEVVIESLFFYINHQEIVNQTTFTYLSRVVSGSLPIPLMNANANTLIQPVSTTDTFQLYIQRIAPTSGASQAPPPLTPILLVADSDTGSTSLIKSNTAKITILRDSGAIRWCLSESPTQPPTTQDACVNNETGSNIVNGWSISRPLDFTFSAGDGPKTLYLWVADQNLNMNAVAAQASVTLDTTPPAAPHINSITLGQTQVAAMSVSHPNTADVAGWCVIEQNSILPPPSTPSLGDDCWNWTQDSAQPTTVGFKSGGTRDVWVYVRDQAGNVSAASNMMAANNPYGAITFTQLTGAASSPTAVFTQNCYTCHANAGNPGYLALHLFDYQTAITVAQNGILVQRINNPISPMPNINNGLMAQPLRDLIKLWTMPESGNTPLP